MQNTTSPNLSECSPSVLEVQTYNRYAQKEVWIGHRYIYVVSQQQTWKHTYINQAFSCAWWHLWVYLWRKGVLTQFGERVCCTEHFPFIRKNVHPPPINPLTSFYDMLAHHESHEGVSVVAMQTFISFKLTKPRHCHKTKQVLPVIQVIKGDKTSATFCGVVDI